MTQTKPFLESFDATHGWQAPKPELPSPQIHLCSTAFIRPLTLTKLGMKYFEFSHAVSALGTLDEIAGPGAVTRPPFLP